jgi:hypothetical protein
MPLTVYDVGPSFSCGADYVPPPLTAGSIQIFVKTLDKTIAIEVNPSDCVGDLKIRIQERESIAWDAQRLSLGSFPLEDGRTLSVYNIQRESTINMLLRLRGGMFHESSGRVDNDKYADSMRDLNLDVTLVIPGVGEEKRSVKPGVSLAELLSQAGGGGNSDDDDDGGGGGGDDDDDDDD